MQLDNPQARASLGFLSVRLSEDTTPSNEGLKFNSTLQLNIKDPGVGIDANSRATITELTTPANLATTFIPSISGGLEIDGLLSSLRSPVHRYQVKWMFLQRPLRVAARGASPPLVVSVNWAQSSTKYRQLTRSVVSIDNARSHRQYVCAARHIRASNRCRVGCAGWHSVCEGSRQRRYQL